MAKGTQDERSRFIALGVKEQNPDIEEFVGDLRSLLRDIEKEGVENRARDYLNAYMSNSLLMHPLDISEGTGGIKGAWLSIKEEDAPWVEATVLYNLSVYLKMFGPNTIKECPGCGKFFTQGKMKYKYCSESCKLRNPHA
jgi:hypothetical protein